MTVGFDQPLYLLCFDQRGSLQREMFGREGLLTPQETEQIVTAKRITYDAFEAAIATSVPKEKAGILVDGQFGSAILEDAAAHGYTTACPAEKSGPDEFDFEDGDDFAERIDALRPTFCKVRVRYNPEGDRARNRRQTERLRRLSNYVHDKSQSRLMFDLLVPAEKGQLCRVNGDRRTYDSELRPDLTVRAIQQLQDAEIEPDVWTIEGLDRREDCKKIVGAVRWGGRPQVGCLIRARGADDREVRQWLTTAASVRGFIGFAAGRTIFWEPLAEWRAGKITRERAVAGIAGRYRDLVDIFEKARAA